MQSNGKDLVDTVSACAQFISSCFFLSPFIFDSAIFSNVYKWQWIIRLNSQSKYQLINPCGSCPVVDHLKQWKQADLWDEILYVVDLYFLNEKLKLIHTSMIFFPNKYIHKHPQYPFDNHMVPSYASVELHLVILNHIIFCQYWIIKNNMSVALGFVHQLPVTIVHTSSVSICCWHFFVYFRPTYIILLTKYNQRVEVRDIIWAISIWVSLHPVGVGSHSTQPVEWRPKPEVTLRSSETTYEMTWTYQLCTLVIEIYKIVVKWIKYPHNQE